MKSLLFSLLICLLLPAAPSWARIAISQETIFERMPVIFSGKVTSVEETDAPTHDFYFTNETKAMAVHFDIDHSWKGPGEKSLTVYTWPKGAAPCTSVTIEAGKSYILWGEWDNAKKNILFDFCRAFMPVDAPDAPRIRAKLDSMFATPLEKEAPPAGKP